jgi:valyl-tRNA synthetase
MKRVEYVFDTWVDSGSMPYAQAHYPFENGDNFEKDLYPADFIAESLDQTRGWFYTLLVQGVALFDKAPYKNVVVAGLILAEDGRKMSKSLGNSPDPIELIKKYGADGVRVGMLVSSPAGNDLPFDSSQCEQGRNFSNKMWNAFRLMDSWEVKDDLKQPAASKIAIDWFESRFNEVLIHINQQFDKFRISDALMATYKLVWDDYCSWFLEMVKPGYQQPIDKTTKEKAIYFFEQLLKLVHPFTPFVSEELWHLIGDRKDGDDIIVSSWPEGGDVNEKINSEFKVASEVITNIRNIRKQNNIAYKIMIDFKVMKSDKHPQNMDDVLRKMGNLSSLNYVDEKVGNAFSFIVQNTDYFVPFGDNVDTAVEREKLEEELEYTKGFLKSVQKKLGNERFVNNAPEQVVVSEKRKQADAEAKIKMIEEKLSAMA